MRTLHLYILRQILATLVLTVLTLTFVLVLGNLLREIMQLLVSGRVSLGLVLKALGLLVPFVMMFALPIGLLTATLLVFGRLSADQELTAAQAAGISVVQLIAPVLVLSLLLTGLSAWFNFYVSPRSRVAYKRLLRQATQRHPTALLEDNQFIKDFPGFVLYIGKVRGNQLQHLVIYQLTTNRTDTAQSHPLPRTRIPRVRTIISAKKAVVRVDLTNHVLRVSMPEALVLYVQSWQWARVTDSEIEFPLPAVAHRPLRPKISEMTWKQLMDTYYINKAVGIRVTPVVFQIHRQAAFAFACFAFTLIGIPLAIQTHRRETSIGVALSLIVMLFYYAFFVLAQSWRDQPKLYPYWIVWIPNLLYNGIGAWLLWRLNRGP